jgi:pSer/pThr/pTyr-binding forkhead associated (FHA) protein
MKSNYFIHTKENSYLTIGRKVDRDIRFTGTDKHISSHHAKINYNAETQILSLVD